MKTGRDICERIAAAPVDPRKTLHVTMPRKPASDATAKGLKAVYCAVHGSMVLRGGYCCAVFYSGARSIGKGDAHLDARSVAVVPAFGERAVRDSAILREQGIE